MGIPPEIHIPRGVIEIFLRDESSWKEASLIIRDSIMECEYDISPLSPLWRTTSFSRSAETNLRHRGMSMRYGANIQQEIQQHNLNYKDLSTNTVSISLRSSKVYCYYEGFDAYFVQFGDTGPRQGQVLINTSSHTGPQSSTSSEWELFRVVNPVDMLSFVRPILRHGAIFMKPSSDLPPKHILCPSGDYRQAMGAKAVTFTEDLEMRDLFPTASGIPSSSPKHESPISSPISDPLDPNAAQTPRRSSRAVSFSTTDNNTVSSNVTSKSVSKLSDSFLQATKTVPIKKRAKTAPRYPPSLVNLAQILNTSYDNFPDPYYSPLDGLTARTRNELRRYRKDPGLLYAEDGFQKAWSLLITAAKEMDSHAYRTAMLLQRQYQRRGRGLSLIGQDDPLIDAPMDLFKSKMWEGVEIAGKFENATEGAMPVPKKRTGFLFSKSKNSNTNSNAGLQSPRQFQAPPSPGSTPVTLVPSPPAPGAPGAGTANAASAGPSAIPDTHKLLRKVHFSALVSRYFSFLADRYTAEAVFDILVQDTPFRNVSVLTVQKTFSQIPYNHSSSSSSSIAFPSGNSATTSSINLLDNRTDASMVSRSDVTKTDALLSPKGSFRQGSHEEVVRLEWEGRSEQLLSYQSFSDYARELGRRLTHLPTRWYWLRDSLQLDPREVIVKVEEYVEMVLSIDLRVKMAASLLQSQNEGDINVANPRGTEHAPTTDRSYAPSYPPTDEPDPQYYDENEMAPRASNRNRLHDSYNGGSFNEDIYNGDNSDSDISVAAADICQFPIPVPPALRLSPPASASHSHPHNHNYDSVSGGSGGVMNSLEAFIQRREKQEEDERLAEYLEKEFHSPTDTSSGSEGEWDPRARFQNRRKRPIRGQTVIGAHGDDESRLSILLTESSKRKQRKGLINASANRPVCLIGEGSNASPSKTSGGSPLVRFDSSRKVISDTNAPTANNGSDDRSIEKVLSPVVESNVSVPLPPMRSVWREVKRWVEKPTVGVAARAWVHTALLDMITQNTPAAPSLTKIRPTPSTKSAKVLNAYLHTVHGHNHGSPSHPSLQGGSSGSIASGAAGAAAGSANSEARLSLRRSASSKILALSNGASAPVSGSPLRKRGYTDRGQSLLTAGSNQEGTVQESGTDSATGGSSIATPVLLDPMSPDHVSIKSAATKLDGSSVSSGDGSGRLLKDSPSTPPLLPPFRAATPPPATATAPAALPRYTGGDPYSHLTVHPEVAASLFTTGSAATKIQGTLFITNRNIYFSFGKKEVLVIPLDGLPQPEYCRVARRTLGLLSLGRTEDTGLRLSDIRVRRIPFQLDETEAGTPSVVRSVFTAGAALRGGSVSVLPSYAAPGFETATVNVSPSVTFIFSQVKEYIVGSKTEREIGGRRRIVCEILTELAAAYRLTKKYTPLMKTLAKTKDLALRDKEKFDAYIEEKKRSELQKLLTEKEKGKREEKVKGIQSSKESKGSRVVGKRTGSDSDGSVNSYDSNSDMNSEIALMDSSDENATPDDEDLENPEEDPTSPLVESSQRYIFPLLGIAVALLEDSLMALHTYFFKRAGFRSFTSFSSLTLAILSLLSRAILKIVTLLVLYVLYPVSRSLFQRVRRSLILGRLRRSGLTPHVLTTPATTAPPLPLLALPLHPNLLESVENEFSIWALLESAPNPKAWQEKLKRRPVPMRDVYQRLPLLSAMNLVKARVLFKLTKTWSPALLLCMATEAAASEQTGTWNSILDSSNSGTRSVAGSGIAIGDIHKDLVGTPDKSALGKEFRHDRKKNSKRDRGTFGEYAVVFEEADDDGDLEEIGVGVENEEELGLEMGMNMEDSVHTGMKSPADLPMRNPKPRDIDDISDDFCDEMSLSASEVVSEYSEESEISETYEVIKADDFSAASDESFFPSPNPANLTHERILPPQHVSQPSASSMSAQRGSSPPRLLRSDSELATEYMRHRSVSTYDAPVHPHPHSYLKPAQSGAPYSVPDTSPGQATRTTPAQPATYTTPPLPRNKRQKFLGMFRRWGRTKALGEELERRNTVLSMTLQEELDDFSSFVSAGEAETMHEKYAMHLRRFLLLDDPILFFNTILWVTQERVIRKRRYNQLFYFDRKILVEQLNLSVDLFMYPMNLARRYIQYLIAWENPSHSLVALLLVLVVIHRNMLQSLGLFLLTTLFLFFLYLGLLSPTQRLELSHRFSRNKTSNQASLFQRLHAFRLMLGNEQVRLARINTILWKLRTLLAWVDTTRSAITLAAIGLVILVFAMVPSRLLWSGIVLQQFTKVFRPQDGLFSRAWRLFWRGLPEPNPYEGIYAPIVVASEITGAEISLAKEADLLRNTGTAKKEPQAGTVPVVPGSEVDETKAGYKVHLHSAQGQVL